MRLERVDRILLPLFPEETKNTHFCFTDIDGEQIIASDSLELVDLRSNPFTNESYDLLKNACVSFYIDLSPRWIKRDRSKLY